MCTRYISIPLFFYLFQKSIINIQLPLHTVAAVLNAAAVNNMEKHF